MKQIQREIKDKKHADLMLQRCSGARRYEAKCESRDFDHLEKATRKSTTEKAGVLRRKSQIAEDQPTEKSGNRKLAKGLSFGRTKSKKL